MQNSFVFGIPFAWLSRRLYLPYPWCVLWTASKWNTFGEDAWCQRRSEAFFISFGMIGFVKPVFFGTMEGSTNGVLYVSWNEVWYRRRGTCFSNELVNLRSFALCLSICCLWKSGIFARYFHSDVMSCSCHECLSDVVVLPGMSCWGLSCECFVLSDFDAWMRWCMKTVSWS